MKIGTYVKYDNDLWELLYIDDVSEKKDLYFLSCRTSERNNLWVSEDEEITETDLSQSYFEL
jgi:hypothetical protein